MEVRREAEVEARRAREEAEATAVLARKRKLEEVDVELDVPLGMDAVLGAGGSWWGDCGENDDSEQA
jgi:hypothetical protein